MRSEKIIADIKGNLERLYQKIRKFLDLEFLSAVVRETLSSLKNNSVIAVIFPRGSAGFILN